MPANIVLKNKANADLTFVYSGSKGTVQHFVKAGTNLLDQERLHLSVIDQGKVARIKGALFVPTVGTNPTTGLPAVVYQEAGSFDLTSVKAAPTLAAEEFVARFKSLVASPAIQAMYTTGVQL